MKKRLPIYRGIAAITAFLLFITVSATTLMFQNAGVINEFLNIRTTKVIELGEGEERDTSYYNSEFGTDYTNKQQALQLEMTVAVENVTQAEEGTVLLRNENNALPLSNGEKVTVFGNGSKTGVFDSTVDSIDTINLYTALQRALGMDHVNTVLYDSIYANLGTTDSSTVIEAELSEVKSHEDSWKNDYNDAAIVVFMRDGGEDKETAMYSEDGSHFLGLQKNERDLMNYLKEQKAAGVFKKIIVIINSVQMMELGWLNDYDADACVLISEVGVTGYEGVANVLVGNVAPSGKTVDTYAANSLSAPAVTYAGENTQVWGNVDEVNNLSADFYNEGATIDYYVIYAEGIYVGYKYYETRYEDSVMNTGNADSSVGSTEGAWNYTNEVVYPFGYGLSYTTFEQEIENVTYDEKTDQYYIEVRVTNIGDLAGKSVVEVYAQTPYGDYEKANLIEKSAITLVGFEKTDSLQPGESVTVRVPVERYMLASYDSKGAAGYILSEGDYYFAIGDDAHDALNNILAAKGYSMADGMTAEGNATKVYSWNQDTLDSESYAHSRFTDAEVTNAFDTADLNYYGVDFTYLSRSDWAGTFPANAVSVNATEEMLTHLNPDWYEIPDDAPSVSDFTQGADNGISFIDMMYADLDDERWDKFLDQFTIEEMTSLMKDSQGVAGVDRLGIPAQVRSNDNSYAGTMVSTGAKSLRWVSQVVTSRTWNKDRFTARGHYMGVESAFCGKNENWYGGGNIHRTPFSGRNWQYYSEDGNFGYIIGSYEAAAMQEAGVMYCIKHFAMNDQESHRQGLCIFATEQSIREEYLRAFEGAFCEGGAMSTMLSLGRIGVYYSAVHPTLVRTVLRSEWGFTGRVTTDGFNGANTYMNHYMEMFDAGVDYFCLDTGYTSAAMEKAISEGDGNMLRILRQMTKENIYPMTKSTSVNGLSSNTILVSIVPWWETAMLAATAVFGLLLAVSTVLTVVAMVSPKKDVRMRKEAE